MSIKTRTKTITESIVINEVFCDFCNIYIGNIDVNGIIQGENGNYPNAEVLVSIKRIWYFMDKHMCEKCVGQKYEAIVGFCENIGLKKQKWTSS